MLILSAHHAHAIFRKKLISDVEEFWALGLTPGLKLIDCQMIFRGTVDSCQVHPRDIFRFAYLCNASRLIVAHNHPSGDKDPSMSDIHITERLIKIGHLMEVTLLDHLILCDSGFHSLAENRDCDFKSRFNSDY